VNGRAITPTVNAPSWRAMEAISGAAPVPVPPPWPAVTKNQVGPPEDLLDLLVMLLGGLRPTFGFARPCGHG
jgi:hypothetical protein